MIRHAKLDQLSESDRIEAKDAHYIAQGMAIMSAGTGLLFLTLAINSQHPVTLSGVILSAAALVIAFLNWRLNRATWAFIVALSTLFTAMAATGEMPYTVGAGWLSVLGIFAAFYSGRWTLLIPALLALALFIYAHTFVNEHIVMTASITIGALTVLCISFSFVNWQRAIRDEVMHSSKAKTEFLSGMSHELRTPLNAIMGFADVLGRGYAGKLGDQQLQYVDNIAVSSRHMLALVNDLLDISRIESGKTEFVPAPVALKTCIDGCVRLFDEDCQKHGLKLDYQPDIPSETMAVLDEMKFKQILLNLISNAIKFSSDGGLISVTATIKDELIRVTVVDNGKGIPAEHENRIFERFYQVNSATDNKSPGAGLGLPISRYFAELHHGRIYLDRSGIRTETRFVLEIPFNRPESTSTEQNAES